MHTHTKEVVSGHPFLFLNLAGRLLLFTVEYYIDVDLSLTDYYVDVPSIPTLRIFIMNGCWILSNAFSASIEMIIWFLSFSLCGIKLIFLFLWLLNHPCDPEINPTWSWWTILFMYCWSQFANILRIFCIYIHQGYWPVSFFCTLFGLGIRIKVSLYNDFGSILSSSVFFFK